MQEGRNDTVFKKPKGPTATTPSSSRHASKSTRTPTKSKPEEKDDLYDEELAGGDDFFADSVFDNRTVTKHVDSDSDSEHETAEDIKLKQSKVYLAKLARGTQQDSDESGSENGMDIDELTSRVAEDAVRLPPYLLSIILYLPVYPIQWHTDRPSLFHSSKRPVKCLTEPKPILYVIRGPPRSLPPYLNLSVLS